MPRLKEWDDVDVDELEEAEYSEGGSYSDYDGEEPPKGTMLSGLVKRLWLSETRNGDPMLVALFEARENEGDEAEFNGWATWDYLALNSGAKFRWAPFFEVTGIQLRDLLGKKSKLFVEEDNDQFGVPIEKIGDWEPGEENDAAWVRVITKVESKGEYKGRAKVDKWLHWDDADTPDEPDEEPDEPDEPDEPEEVETPPTRTRSASRTARTASSAAKPATARSSRAATAEPAAKPAARATRSRAAAAKPATSATRPASRARGGRAASGSTEEPPF